MRRGWAVIAAIGALASGCSEGGGADSDALGDTGPSVTWAEVQPMLARRCLGCHAEGGLAGLRLDTYEDAKAQAVLALGAMESGVMPPWMPSPGCHPLQHERRLDEAELALFRGWVEGGVAPGTPPVIEREETAFAPNEHLVISEGYVPDPSVTDDYHCFVVDRTFDVDTYVTGSQVVPGSAAVHHVLVYAILPSQLPEVDARDAAHPGPGYPCFAQPVSTGFADEGAFLTYLGGGELPNFDFPDQLGAWVPGTLPRVLPEGTAYRVPAGSRVVVQIHYATAGAGPDTTTLALMTRTEAPTSILRTRPVAVLDLDIPAGARAVTHARAFPYQAEEPLEIVGVMAHMHLLGRAFRASVVREDEACLLDIADWDFHWQESYLFPVDAPVVMRPGEALEVSCTYDNTPMDQALLPDGTRPAPRDVAWGEGTRDEMCLFYYTSRHPFAPLPEAGASACEAASACVAACRAQGEASLGCVLGCSDATIACQLCAVRAGLQCSDFDCLPVLAEATECMATCLEAGLMLGSNLGRCLEASCPEAYDEALACLDPGLARAECDAGFSACGEVR